jgi:carboxymethylenebutenolidase
MQRSEIEIQTPDGMMSAYEVAPESDAKLPALLFFMDGLGYRAALHTMADRLAEAGYHVLLPDLFYRAGRQINFDPAIFTQPDKLVEVRKLMGGLTTDMVMSDARVCLDRLVARADVNAGRIGALGYCMGGRNAFLAATRFPDRIRATASIHAGGIVTPDPEMSPHLSASHAKARMYFAVAKDDMFFTKEHADTLDRTLEGLGKEFQIEHYDARHGWAVIDTPVYDAAEAERAHAATLALFAETLAG